MWLALEPFQSPYQVEATDSWVFHQFQREVGFEGEFKDYEPDLSHYCEQFADKAAALAWGDRAWAGASQEQRRLAWYPGKALTKASPAKPTPTKPTPAKPEAAQLPPKSRPGPEAGLVVTPAPKPAPSPPQAATPAPKPAPRPAPVAVAAPPPPPQCPMVQRKVSPVTAAFPTRNEAEASARAKVANACGAKGVASLDLARACQSDTLERVAMANGKVTGITRTVSWTCMPVATCVDRVEQCGGPKNSPASAGKQ
jgi:hypothetical protein